MAAWQGLGMALARIGPLTSGLEAVATAVGSGLLLGSFTIGTGRFFLGFPRSALEAHALTDGFYGGIFSVWLILIDLGIR
jgi:hypothetical protein